MVMERPVVRQALRHYPAACFWGTPVIGQETSKTISCVALGRARLLPCAPDGRRLGAGRGLLWRITPLVARLSPRAPNGMSRGFRHARRTGADLVRGAAGGWALAAYGLGAAVTAPWRRGCKTGNGLRKAKSLQFGAFFWEKAFKKRPSRVYRIVKVSIVCSEHHNKESQ